MSKTKIRSIALALGPLALLALAAFAQAEIAQKGDLQVKFEGELTPHSLPRTPRPRSTSRSPPRSPRSAKPSSRSCAQCRSRSTATARSTPRACRSANSTTSSRRPPPTRSPSAASRWSAKAPSPPTCPSPGRAPFPAEGKLYAFNGVVEGTPGDPRPRLRRAAGADLLHPGLPDLQGRWHLRHHPQGRPAEVEGRGHDHRDLARPRQDLQVPRQEAVLRVRLLPGAEGRQGRGLPLRQSLARLLGRPQGRPTLNRSCSVRGK